MSFKSLVLLGSLMSLNLYAHSEMTMDVPVDTDALISEVEGPLQVGYIEKNHENSAKGSPGKTPSHGMKILKAVAIGASAGFAMGFMYNYLAKRQNDNLVSVQNVVPPLGARLKEAAKLSLLDGYEALKNPKELGFSLGRKVLYASYIAIGFSVVSKVLLTPLYQATWDHVANFPSHARNIAIVSLVAGAAYRFIPALRPEIQGVQSAVKSKVDSVLSRE